MALASPIRRIEIFDSGVPRWELAGQAAVFGSWIAVTAIGAYLTPDTHGHGTHQQLGLPPCPSTLLFSRPCPGCGLTTSWSAFIHGDFAFAFHAHALGPLSYLIFTLVAFAGGYGWLMGKRLRTYTPTCNRLVVAFIVGFIFYGALRFATTPNFATPYERQAAAFMIGR